MSEATSDDQQRHEELRQEEGPTSRRRRALRQLRAMAGRYRKRYIAACTLALLLAVAFALTAAGVFESEEHVTLGTGPAGVMSDSTRMADSVRTADSLRARVDSLRRDSVRQAGAQQTAAETDNTGVVGEVLEEVAEVVGRGEASYYGSELAGNPTASGEPFDPAKLTAAHRTLPLGSQVRVTNLRNGETVVVRINDRGPFHGNRILDLSRRAAQRIGMLTRGKARVKIELLEE